MQTLYSDLPKESIVAQLGLHGRDPHLYSQTGAPDASCWHWKTSTSKKVIWPFVPIGFAWKGPVLASYNPTPFSVSNHNHSSINLTKRYAQNSLTSSFITTATFATPLLCETSGLAKGFALP